MIAAGTRLLTLIIVPVITLTLLLGHGSWPSIHHHLPCVSCIAASAASSPTKLLANPAQAHNGPYVFATFLSGHNTTDPDHPGGDGYFEAVRLMNYQLRYSPATKGAVPLLVMVADDVDQSKREQLEREGARIATGPRLTPPWVSRDIGSSRWGDVMLKLHLWHMVEYEKICFLDAPLLIYSRMDDIFWAPQLQVRPTGQDPKLQLEANPQPPEEYMFAALADRGAMAIWGQKNESEVGYFNAGFFCLQPNKRMFNHLISVLDRPGSFPPLFPEQGLLNQVFRPDGNVPWQRLERTWNTNVPSVKDVVNGVKSLHSKLWLHDGTGKEAGYENEDAELYRIWKYIKREMDACFASAEMEVP